MSVPCQNRIVSQVFYIDVYCVVAYITDLNMYILCILFIYYIHIMHKIYK